MILVWFLRKTFETHTHTHICNQIHGASLVAQTVKNLPAIQES